MDIKTINHAELVNEYMELSHRATMVEHENEVLKRKTSRIDGIIEKLIPLVGSFISALINIKAILRLIKELIRAR